MGNETNEEILSPSMLLVLRCMARGLDRVAAKVASSGAPKVASSIEDAALTIRQAMKDAAGEDVDTGEMSGDTKYAGMDMVSFIMDFEAGELPLHRVVDGIQQLIQDGTIYKLQGFYGRTAKSLQEAGVVWGFGEKERS